MLTAAVTAAVALSGAAATPCDAHGVTCQRAHSIVRQWQNSTADPLPLYGPVRFRIGRAHWVCTVRFPYGQPYDLASCHRQVRRDVRFTVRTTPTPKPWHPCAGSLPVRGVTTLQMAVTNGTSCGTLERLILTRSLPTSDTTVVDHPGWGRCEWHGSAGNPAKKRPNLISFQCETLPTAATSLTQAVTASFASPLTPGSAFCRINAVGDCTWNGETATN